MQDIRLTAALAACFSIFPVLTNAFWRLPCRGRTGVARLDPIVDPGEISSHVHAIHGGGNFGMSADMDTLLESSCTSCAVTQDLSAYWTPALYFMHTNGSAELVEQVGGMLAYYLLYGENITAFPNNFRMLAGDPFQRNFTWPVPDPPKSSWSGAQVSQKALRQKALGFNCLNYAAAAEASLYRHYMPNKTYLDEHCTDGLRLELMFPSCWNGKDVDSDDHKSHVAYPDLVMTGTCPEGYETQLVSLFYETIWNTYAFKDVDGYFALANGDPTGYGYHGDFMYGWEEGVLQDAVDTCTSATGEVDDCGVFDIQTETKERECFFDMPEALESENVEMHANGLPGDMAIQWGPAYATMGSSSSSATTTSSAWISLPTISLPTVSVSISIDTGNVLGKADALDTATTTSTSTSTSSPTPTPTTSISVDSITEEIIYLEQDIIVMIDENGTPYATQTGEQRTVSSATTTAKTTSTVISYVERDTIPELPEKRDRLANHVRRHAHNQHRHLHNGHAL